MKIKRNCFKGYVTYYGTDKVVEVGKYKEKKEELRGVWFSTVGNIDIPKMESVESYKEYLDGVIKKCKEFHLNTVVFQVRPTSDALYESTMNPWSSVMTGVQGKDPGFDVFGYKDISHFIEMVLNDGVYKAWVLIILVY